MTVLRIDPDVKARLLASIRRFFAEELEEEIGDLKAALVLDYVLKEIAPTVYNRAVADAQLHLNERLAELDGSLYLPEFGYWKG